jgi:hypothetical protein
MEPSSSARKIRGAACVCFGYGGAMGRFLFFLAAIGCSTNPGTSSSKDADGTDSALPEDHSTGGDSDSASPDDSADPAPPRRTCTPLAVIEVQAFADLMGELDELGARLALPGPGLAVGDLNGDGHHDVILARPGAPALLFEGDGTGQLVRSELVLPQGDTVALGLLNNDPHLDIVLAGAGEDVVLLSDAEGNRTPVPLPQAERHTTTVSVFDADLDGDLDLFAPRHNWPADFELLGAGLWYGDGHALLLNDGSGGFSVDSRGVGTIRGSLAFQGAPVDVDLDGDLDVYLNNDFGAWTQPNMMMMNDGTGGLTLRPGDGTDLAMFGMGTSVADPTGDGWPDLFTSNIGNVALFQSLGDGTFVESAAAHGLVEFHDEHHIASWGSRFIDLDGDRYDDLALGYSSVPNEPIEREPDGLPGGDTGSIERERIQNDLLLLFDPADHRFRSAAVAGHTVAAFEGNHGTKPLVAADLDSDGRPELLKAGYSAAFDDLVLRTYRLDGGCGPGVTVRFPTEAPWVGARVVAEVDGVETTRWMLPGATYGASAAEVFVGTGESTVVDRLEVFPLYGPSLDFSDSSAGTVVDLSRF